MRLENIGDASPSEPMQMWQHYAMPFQNTWGIAYITSITNEKQ